MVHRAASDEVVFTVNSPGEVSTWLAPTAAAIKELAPDLRVSVLILPCLYASGTEVDVILRMPGVDAVVGPRESFRYILWGRLPRTWRPAGRGVVLFMGGELYLAARLAKRLGYPAVAYTEGYINTPGAFSRVFVPRETSLEKVTAKGVPKERVQVVGDLMVDAAQVATGEDERAQVSGALGLDKRRPTVAIFPGSRPYELRLTLPLFGGAAARLARALPGVQFVVALSPYTTRDMLTSGLEEVARQLGGEQATQAARVHDESLDRLFTPGLEEVPVEGSLVTADGTVEVLFWRGGSRAAMAGAQLALTIPGSNTAELAAWGVPMIVCLPLSRPEEVPLDGVLGYIDKIPVVGRKLKAKAVLKFAERTPYLALPNRIAREMIASELRSTQLSPVEVAQEAERLLADPEALGKLGSRLAEVMGADGAARAIARQTLELLQREEPLPGGSP